MKKLITFLALALAAHLSYGQACGIYRIKYTGQVSSKTYTIKSIQFPTTMHLHGLENADSIFSYIDTKPVDGKFNLEISSHLTTPYNSPEALLTFYKTQSPGLKLIVAVEDNTGSKSVLVEIAWGDITVSVVKDGKFGTLFEFKFKEIVV